MKRAISIESGILWSKERTKPNYPCLDCFVGLHIGNFSSISEIFDNSTAIFELEIRRKLTQPHNIVFVIGLSKLRGYI